MKNYKSIWDNLTPTFSDARFVVGYLGEESDIRENGTYTADFLGSIFQMKPTDKVLEIGCGIARIGRELAPRCAEWHGSDISGNMIAFAHERTKDLPNVFLHELPEPNLSIFNDGYFDCVYSTIVFMHLDKVEMFNYMREAFRVLAPGGKFYCDTYNVASPDGWQQFMNIVEAFSADTRPGHVSQFSTPPEMEKFMTEAGFIDLEVDDSNPALVVALGRKPEQSGFERPESASNAEEVARTRAEIKKRIEQAERSAEETRLHGFTVEGDRAIVVLDKWIGLSKHVASKDEYIARLEATLSKKDAHINTLEKRLRKIERATRPLPVRVAMRLSKGR